MAHALGRVMKVTSKNVWGSPMRGATAFCHLWHDLNMVCVSDSFLQQAYKCGGVSGNVLSGEVRNPLFLTDTG